MSVTATNSSTSGTGAAASASTAGASSQSVTIQEFMQLLSTEMSNQDPLQPMDPTQSMTQLAQFTTLQQMTQMSQTQSLSAADALLGEQVTVPGANNQSVTGTVTAIDSSGVSGGSPPNVIISGSSTEFPLTSITNFQEPPAAAATPSTTSSPANSSGS